MKNRHDRFFGNMRGDRFFLCGSTINFWDVEGRSFLGCASAIAFLGCGEVRSLLGMRRGDRFFGDVEGRSLIEGFGGRSLFGCGGAIAVYRMWEGDYCLGLGRVAP